MSDKRHPVLEKIGCYYMCPGEEGIVFFKKGEKISDGDVFIYNQGILWRVKS